MVSLDQLQSICKTSAGRSACAKYLPHLNMLMPIYGIDRPHRIAAFLAQIAHESSDFTRVAENMNYSAAGLAATWPRRFRDAGGEPNQLALRVARNPEAIANAAYSGRLGNGPAESGDGWRYRGRGLKQLTGRANYRACGEAIGVDLVAQPGLLEMPEYAAQSACWFWQSSGCSELADRGDFVGLTKRINGGLIGLDQRREYFERATRAIISGAVA